MKIYKKLVFDKDDNLIEAESYEHTGPVAECKGGGGGGGGFIGKIFRAVTDIVGSIVKIFTSPFGLDYTVPDYTQQSDESIQGVLLNKDSGISPVPVVYGTRLVGGSRVFVSTTGSSQEYLYVAYVLSEGQIQGYDQLLIDDIVVPLTSFAHGVEANATIGPYNAESRLKVQFFDGRDNQVASTLLKEAPGWTDNHRLQGLAYLACRFRWKKIETQDDSDNNPWQGGIPNIKARVQGRKIFDLVSGYTPTDYGSLTSSEGYSINTDQTLATKAKTFSVINGYLFENSTQPNTINFSSSSDEAEVKITLNADLQSNNNNYADYRLGILVRRNGSVYRPDDVGFDGPLKVIKQSDGVVADSYEYTFSNLTQADSWQFEPTFTLRSPSSTITGTGSITVEVKTPEFEDHVTAYADEPVSFNNNPANVLLDYLRNTRYGKGLANEAIDYISFRRAALQCDQTVAYTDTSTGKAFTCDAVIATEASLMNNTKLLLSGFRGIMPYQQGKFVLKIENAGDDSDIEAIPSDPAVAFTATQDNIVGGLQLAGDSKETRYNRARVTYVDPDSDYQPNEVIYPEDGSADDTAFLAEDNGTRLETTLSLPTVASREQALQYAEVFVKRSRNAKQIQFVTNLSGSDLAVGDLCRVISNNIGLDGVFRITDIRLTSEGGLQITGFEHQPTAYVINAKSADITRPALNLPDPLDVVAPTGLTVQSGTAFNLTTNTGGYVEEDSTVRRLFVSWTATTDPFVREYLVEFKESAESEYNRSGSTSVTQFFIPAITQGTQYDVRVATRNELGRRSDWVYVLNHTAQ